jgi:acylphosphatase
MRQITVEANYSGSEEQLAKMLEELVRSSSSFQNTKVTSKGNRHVTAKSSMNTVSATMMGPSTEFVIKGSDTFISAAKEHLNKRVGGREVDSSGEGYSKSGRFESGEDFIERADEPSETVYDPPKNKGAGGRNNTGGDKVQAEVTIMESGRVRVNKEGEEDEFDSMMGFIVGQDGSVRFGFTDEDKVVTEAEIDQLARRLKDTLL